MWRKQYRKYKPLTVPKKCVGCDQKSVKDAYHIICHACAVKEAVCAKCRQPKDLVQPVRSELVSENVEQQKLQNFLDSLSERHRRSALRRIERDGIEAVMEAFSNKATSNIDDMWSDDDIDDSEEESDAWEESEECDE
jgi:hypothetical protein